VTGSVSEKDQSYRRSWFAIGIATMIVLVSYGALLVAVVAARSDTPDAAGPAFAVGFALVPIVFVALAFLSGRRNAAIQVLKAMGVWLLVALPLGLFNPVFGLVLGFGLGGVLTLRERETDTWKVRSIAVVIVAVYTLGMLFVFPGLGLLSGGLLPISVLGIADTYTQNRAVRPA
jgi:hypothetical protein